MNVTKITRAICLTGAIYGALGFIYIAGNAWNHPDTLPLPLTHFASFPREDTAGAIAFVASGIFFFLFMLHPKPKK